MSRRGKRRRERRSGPTIGYGYLETPTVWLPKDEAHDEWARVLEMRQSPHGLHQGGHYREVREWYPNAPTPIPQGKGTPHSRRSFDGSSIQ